jgi:hypothetical protein
MELIGDPQLFSRHRAAVTILFTTVSPPSFSPQPPGRQFTNKYFLNFHALTYYEIN